MSRPNKDEYFLRIARDVATRGTCDRKQVGYIIVKDGQILVTGYNGSITGQPHCDDDGHMMENDHCIRTIHAEMNAIIQAALHGISTHGATMYGTYGPPCWDCFKCVANAGIKEIIYLETTGERHKLSLVKQTAAKSNISLYWWGEHHEL